MLTKRTSRQCFKVLQYDFFCSGQQKHELTRCQTTRGISRLLPAPLQPLASTLRQARLFLILLPEKAKKISLSWYLPLGWDPGSFPLIRNSLPYYQWEYILYSPQFYARNSMPGPHFFMQYPHNHGFYDGKARRGDPPPSRRLGEYGVRRGDAIRYPNLP